MLVPSDEKYAELFLKWRGEASTRRFNPVKSLSLAEARRRLRDSGTDLRALQSGVEYRWFVEQGGQIVGTVALTDFNSMMLYAEIGYLIGEEFAGRGYGTAAVRELARKVFAETGVRKLCATIHVENEASCRLVERVGFKREGLLRQQFLIQGEPADEFYYGLLRSEFQVT